MNICIIPARGGSKRIPKKNIKHFLGKPIIAYSIENAKKSNLFDLIIVSTDPKEIEKVAISYGVLVHQRKKYNDDYASSMDVFDYVIDEYSKKYDIKYACMLYATAPLLDVKYLIKGFNELKNSDACYSFSVTSMPFPIQRTFEIKNNRCEMFFKEHFYSRSQDLKEAYQDAGEFYWKKIGCKSDDIFFGKDTIPIIIPRYLVQDIDTLEDWQRAELMYQSLNKDSFDKWNEVKKKLNKHNSKVILKERNVYLLSIGYNIDNEIYGKKEKFLRPVLVLKKLGSDYFIGIPLTKTKKIGSYFYNFTYIKNIQSTALLNQVRMFNKKRIIKYHGRISNEDFRKIKEQFIRLFDSPIKGEGVAKKQQNLSSDYNTKNIKSQDNE